MKTCRFCLSVCLSVWQSVSHTNKIGSLSSILYCHFNKSIGFCFSVGNKSPSHLAEHIQRHISMLIIVKGTQEVTNKELPDYNCRNHEPQTALTCLTISCTPSLTWQLVTKQYLLVGRRRFFLLNSYLCIECLNRELLRHNVFLNDMSQLTFVILCLVHTRLRVGLFDFA